MPMPKPKKEEKEIEFISRCMGNKLMKKEYPKNNQRLAVCYSQWKRKVSILNLLFMCIMIRRNKMLGIECRFECPACGNILKTQSPFWTKKQRKDIAEPIKCTCGRKGNFRLVSFEQCNFEVVEE